MIDLHCHTNISDSNLSIAGLLKQAQSIGLKYLAVTDHDTTKGLKAAVELGPTFKIKVIPGIEISAFDAQTGKKVHILGYYVNPDSGRLDNFCEDVVKRRHQAALDSLTVIQEEGYNISLEQVQKYVSNGTGIYKQHIMQALVDAGYTDDLLNGLYKKLFSSKKPYGLAYRPIKYVDAGEAVRAVIADGGTPVLAHPLLYANLDSLPGLIENGLKGIEVYHPEHNQKDIPFLLNLARQKNLIVTGGSDYHGGYGQQKEKLGAFSPPPETIEKLRLAAKAGNPV
jgi:predicted metal-dependent phosphoesterase TrpH